MKYFSLFSGVGGFELAINNVYHKISLLDNNNLCYNKDKCESVQNVKLEPSSTAKIILGVRSVRKNTVEKDTEQIQNDLGRLQEDGIKPTPEDLTNFNERGQKEESSTSSMPMVENVLVAENQHQNSYPSTTKTTTDTKIEKNTEPDKCTNSQLSEDSPTHTNFSALTATTQSHSMDNAPICVGFSEIDKYAIAVYNYQFPNTPNYGDISKINWKTVPDFDLVVGGSPCQDLSVAGKQKGLSGARSGLFFEFVRCLEEKKPTNFIWENVKGVMSSRKGFDFGSILTAFSEAGYDCEWQVLNARDFGVPQNRERIFVVGHLRGKSRPKVFPITTSSQKNVIQINSSDWRGANRNQRQTTIRQPLKFLQRNQKNIEGDYAFTVDSANTGGVKVDTKIRRLTPLECERLMSWPDEWTKFGTDINVPISDTQRYKMCGNGVVSKVVEAIIERL